MLNRGGLPSIVSWRTAFLLVFALVTVVLVGSSFGLVTWIRSVLLPPPAAAAPNIYTNYQPGSAHVRGESLQAMSAYIAANPNPQNVQILQGMTTAQISAYMVEQVSGGLRVDCTFCHVLNDPAGFAADLNPNKNKARTMMRMTAGLNQQWVSQLQQSVGTKQVTCATCHNGQNVFETYPASIQNTQPADWQLPLDLQYPGGLVVTGREDRSLEDVALNQQTMYHMNVSLGVGCTFCHNARYFPSNEVPQKGHATLMLQMVQSVANNPEYVTAMNNKVPSCYTCHQGANLPPGSANRPEDVPAVLSTNPPTDALRPPTTCTLCHPAAVASGDKAGAAGSTVSAAAPPTQR